MGVSQVQGAIPRNSQSTQPGVSEQFSEVTFLDIWREVCGQTIQHLQNQAGNRTEKREI